MYPFPRIGRIRVRSVRLRSRTGAPPAGPRRSIFRYTIRELILLTALVSVFVGWACDRSRLEVEIAKPLADRERLNLEAQRLRQEFLYATGVQVLSVSD